MKVRYQIVLGDLNIDDTLSDAEKIKVLVERGHLPRGGRYLIEWADPETGWVIRAKDARDPRRGSKTLMRLQWDREYQSTWGGGKRRHSPAKPRKARRARKTAAPKQSSRVSLLAAAVNRLTR